MCFGSPKLIAPPPVAAPPPIPVPKARSGVQQRRKKPVRTGTAATQLTGGQGVTEEADVRKKQLLGG